MKYGRVDVTAPEQCPEEGRLPGKEHRICWYLYFAKRMIQLVNLMQLVNLLCLSLYGFIYVILFYFILNSSDD